MSLPPGARLGPYEILSALGAGGMGEVYRARDSKLGRDVAIKILPDAFASDPERLARFEREARTLALLNHPNIAQVYGLEEGPAEAGHHTAGDVASGFSRTRALVMELVEGEDLSQRIARGPIPLEEALPIAKQIADALEAAHEQGIVHRDLKPANIKLRSDGTVKVLDFGLAKAMGPSEGDGFSRRQAEAEASALRTITSPAMTMRGMILGTAAYMSPEQAAGKPVDKRSDLWAFGVVLLEMLTGRPVFTGETVSHVMAAVLKSDPDWTLLPADTPPTIRRLLRRCLEKDRKRRLESAADARLEIEEAIAEPHAPPSRLTPTQGRRWSRGIPWVLFALASAAALVLLARGATLPATVPPLVSRALIDFPQFALSGARQGNLFALSPDGMRLVFVGNPDGKNKLYLRRLDQFEATPIPGTENAIQPFFAPDGNSVGFFAGGKLKRVSLAGGAPATLADAPDPQGGSWGADDTIVFGPDSRGLMKISAAGGAAERLTKLSSNGMRHSWPLILPGGQAAVFTDAVSASTSAIDLVSLTTGAVTRVVDSGCCAAYARSGHLVYAHPGSGAIFAAPFDPDRPEVVGKPVQMLEGVMSGVTYGGQLGVSETGSLIYLENSGVTERSYVWVDRIGRSTPVDFERKAYGFPTLSPDGRRVVMTVYDGLIPREIWTGDLERGTLSRLFRGALTAAPIWTRDGSRVTFASTVDGPQNIYWMRADGTGSVERLTTGDFGQVPQDWSPDGRTLVFWERHAATGYDLWSLALDSERTTRPLVATPFNEIAARFSPDGRHIAYISDRTGRFEVYVQPLPGPGEVRQVSTDGGTEPVWAASGRELFFRQGDKMMVADVATAPAFSTSRPRLLFEGRYETSFLVPGMRFYDVSPDGQRFLMVKSDTQAAPRQLRLVVNWFEELKAKVPSPR